MISVTFYVISKRVNSTALPASSGTTYSGSLIDSTSLLSPSIRINDAAMQTGSSVPAYNYAQFAGRYYWVTNWTYTSAGWVAEMTVDVLATYRTEIGSYSPYVLRSSYRRNGDIIDTMYPLTQEVNFAKVEANPLWQNPSPVTGLYVIGINGYVPGTDASGMAGTISYLAMPQATFQEFRNALWGDTLTMFKAEGEELGISDSLAKMLFKPSDYIVSCTWIPANASDLSGLEAVSYWNVGFWVFTPSEGNAMYSIANTSSFGTNRLLQIPKHPTAASRGDYLNGAEFSRYNLYVPAFGVIPLNNKTMYSDSFLYLSLTADAATGDAILLLYSQPSDSSTEDDRHLLGLYTANISVPVQLSQNQTALERDPISVLSQPVASAATVALGPFGLGHKTASEIAEMSSAAYRSFRRDVAMSEAAAEAGAAGAIGSAKNAFDIAVQASGSSGGFRRLFGWPILYVEFYIPADDNNPDMGRPLCEITQISTIPGYIQCADAELSIAGATASEVGSIASFMLEGFYYE